MARAHQIRKVTTTCAYCGVGCQFDLVVRRNRIIGVSSNAAAPVNGMSLCVKGRFGYDFIYHPRRVTTPLIRKKFQQPGNRTQAFDRNEWREASWDEALDTIADRLVEIYRREGPQALAVYCCAKATNEDNYLMQKMYRSLFRTNNIDHCTRLCHAGSVVALQMAVGSSAMSNTAAEVIHNDVFIVTGSNTAETHPIIAIQMKAAVEKYGAGVSRCLRTFLPAWRVPPVGVVGRRGLHARGSARRLPGRGEIGHGRIPGPPVAHHHRHEPLALAVTTMAALYEAEFFEEMEQVRGRVLSRGAAPTIQSTASGRLELANWLTAPENPLTARVMANRVWLHLLGEGIVRTPDNFGATGEPPTHHRVARSARVTACGERLVGEEPRCWPLTASSRRRSASASPNCCCRATST